MAKRKREIAHTPADPTLTTTEIEIKGEKYVLCFDFGALAEAEFHFMQAGIDVNLMAALPKRSLWGSRVIFACAAHRFRPEMSFEQLKAVVTAPVSYAVWPFVINAWAQSLAETEHSKGAEKQTPSEP